MMEPHRSGRGRPEENTMIHTQGELAPVLQKHCSLVPYPRLKSRTDWELGLYVNNFIRFGVVG